MAYDVSCRVLPERALQSEPHQVWPLRRKCCRRAPPTKVVCTECIKICCLGVKNSIVRRLCSPPPCHSSFSAHHLRRWCSPAAFLPQWPDLVGLALEIPLWQLLHEWYWDELFCFQNLIIACSTSLCCGLPASLLGCVGQDPLLLLSQAQGKWSNNNSLPSMVLETVSSRNLKSFFST